MADENYCHTDQKFFFNLPVEFIMILLKKLNLCIFGSEEGAFLFILSLPVLRMS